MSQKLTSDYLNVKEPEEGLLERNGYTKEQFIAWATGKSAKDSKATKNIKVVSKEEQDSILDDLL